MYILYQYIHDLAHFCGGGGGVPYGAHNRKLPAFGLSPYRIFGLPTHPNPLFKIQQNSFTFNT